MEIIIICLAAPLTALLEFYSGDSGCYACNNSNCFRCGNDLEQWEYEKTYNYYL
jgi:hypothetical protein